MRSKLSFCELQAGTREIESSDSYYDLYNDLIHHLWMVKRQFEPLFQWSKFCGGSKDSRTSYYNT